MTEKSKQEKTFFSTVHAEARVEEPEETVQEDPEDPKPAIEEACGNTSACAPLKHHIEECNNRVEAGGTEETCCPKAFRSIEIIFVNNTTNKSSVF
ncbi:10614_t:CDS:2 [Cetraspora pellucida]|uniref:10614_t:CDS:1 n=1 Tax=Cetraspora pellucida TaxID=1433469 RepID=A0A9N9I9X7_9GLOM|nr:10614_t:CDS:2 [Cetraspora pellucida]